MRNGDEWKLLEEQARLLRRYGPEAFIALSIELDKLAPENRLSLVIRLLGEAAPKKHRRRNPIMKGESLNQQSSERSSAPAGSGERDLERWSDIILKKPRKE